MSEQLSFDRKKGFVALPVEILEIDLTPGAFRLLVELCRMANADGECWPSLEQLGERLGRSKAAISGYIKSLRSAGLVSTQEQKMANGYNYRLKYHVTFWKDWRAGLKGCAELKAERSVRPGERILKDKNHIHKNQPLAAPAACQIDKILLDWARCFKGAPYPLTSTRPSETLLFKSRQAAKQRSETPIISADIIPALSTVWESLRVKLSAQEVKSQADLLQKSGYAASHLGQFVNHLKASWAPHWRKPPTPEQFVKLVKSSGITPEKQKLALLQSYLKRWALAENSLNNSGHSRLLKTSKTDVTASAIT